MSIRAGAWAREQVDLCDRTGFDVLKELADHAGADDVAFASVPTLARLCKVSERTVQRALRTLESAGLIVGEDRYRDNGSMTSRAYRFPVSGTLKPRPPGDTVSPPPVTECHRAGDTGVTPPVTTVSPAYELPLEPSRAYALSERARADRSIFDLALSAYPASGRGVSDVEAAWRAWSACGVADDRLLGAVQRYAADPSLKKREFGAPSFQRWLSERRFQTWLSDEASPSAQASNAVWPGPADLRAAIVAKLGEPFAVAYLDPSSWIDGRRELIPRTGVAADKLRRQAAAELSNHRVVVGAAVRPGVAA